MKKDTTAKFEFAQNEHLTGRIFMSENPTGQLCQVKFTTSLDREFEAGVKHQYKIEQVFFVKRNFLAGIFGRVSNQQKVVSLGFILYKDYVKQD